MTAADLFRRMVALLDEAGIPYMLTGSFAISYHGVPRATQDIDLVIAPARDQLRQLLARLPASEYYADHAAAFDALDREAQFNVIDLATGWKIDFICRKSRPFSLTEFDRRTRAQLHGLTLFIATAEDVILAKLEWAKLGGSLRQVEDVAGLLRVRGEDLDMSYLTTGSKRSASGPNGWRPNEQPTRTPGPETRRIAEEGARSGDRRTDRPSSAPRTPVPS